LTKIQLNSKSLMRVKPTISAALFARKDSRGTPQNSSNNIDANKKKGIGCFFRFT